ncbi:MAG TPA: ATP-binding protein [Candidatus Didemnitutus sp.]|nr:ATP-binding protein [Candidatus Didemnitutus sp.]
MTRYLIVSSFLNFLAAGMLAFAVVVRGRKDSINVRFGVFALAIGSWSAGYLLWQISEDAVRALFFTRLLMFFAYFVPTTFLHFIVELCGERKRTWVRIAYAVSAVFAGLNFTSLMVDHIEPVRGFPYWPIAGACYWLYLLFFAACTVYAGWLLVSNLRTATGGRAVQLRNILIASIVGFGGGATNFPLWYRIPLPPLGMPLIFLYLVIMAHAVSRYQLPLVTYDFMHAAVHVGFSVTIAVIYLVVLAAISPFIDYPLTPETLLTQFMLCVVVCLFFIWAVPRMNRAANRLMAETYLRRRNTQQMNLKELSRRIAALGSEQEIFENSVREITRAFGLGAAAVYARSEFDHDYQLRAMHGWSRCPPALPLSSPLARVFAQRMAPLLIDGTELELGPAVAGEIEQFRRELAFEAAFPVASDDFLSGLLLLGRREGGERYTEAELSLLESTCLQIAVTLRARQLERRASQTEKLISLGTLAAGLAHELRNPLTSVQTFTALLKEKHPDPEALHEFSSVVLRDVNRITSIVENVSAFAESNIVAMTSVHLPDVLQTVADIVRPELTRTGVKLEVPVVTVPPVRGNNSQLLQVFLNLTQNAIQALDGKPGGRISFGLDTRVTDVPQPLLFVSVADNGPGIDPDVLPRIFEPFTTTKATGARIGKHGMGLGLAIVKRIIQHHHGDIDVTSAVGGGTTFRVQLPLFA